MRKTLHIFSSVVVFFIIIILVLIAGIRITGIVPYNYLNGSIIYVRPTTDATQIKAQDTITYVLNENNHIATNTVYSVNEDKRFFYIKSSELSYNDPSANSALNIDGVPVVPISFDNLIGKTLVQIPFIGYIAEFMSQKIGFIVLVVFMLSVMITMIATTPRKPRAEQTDINSLEPIENDSDDNIAVDDNAAEEKSSAEEIPSYTEKRSLEESASKKYSRSTDLSDKPKDEKFKRNRAK